MASLVHASLVYASLVHASRVHAGEDTDAMSAFLIDRT
jgi:hypothetical protein